MVDRLLDLLLIAVLRAWFVRPGAEGPGWHRAQGDPIVGQVLRIMTNNPELPWTVASLGAEAGVSRAALARRFHEFVGELPMTFLTEWRRRWPPRCTDPTRSSGRWLSGSDTAARSRPATAFKRVRAVSPAGLPGSGHGLRRIRQLLGPTFWYLRMARGAKTAMMIATQMSV